MGKNSGEGALLEMFFICQEWGGKFLWGSKEVRRLKLYKGGKPQSGEPSFLGAFDPSQQHALKEKNVPFPAYFTSLY